MLKDNYTPSLSKSRFLAGLQCLKRLYLQHYHSDLASQENNSLQAILDQGHEVGVLATKAFPGGIAISQDYLQQKNAEEQTQRFIADEGIPALFEAAFTYNNIRIRVDILERLTSNCWRIIEVKSSTEVKPHHLPDVAIQKYVLEGCGFQVSEVCLMHLNRNYVYDGIEYKLNELFTIEDQTAAIQTVFNEIPDYLNKQYKTLNSNTIPNVSPGKHCESPFECEFYNLCNPPLPKDWVGNLPHLHKNRINALLEQGITSIHNIPQDFHLSDRQRCACTCIQTNTPYFAKELKDIFSKLEHPLYFIDFETIFPALPRFAGMRPFDQITFQWSLHVQQEPNCELKHYEFLSDDGKDPRESFINSLLDIIGENGHIVVYNQIFESTRLSELAKYFPQHKDRIEKIQQRLWDLLPIIRTHVYHPDFGGSYSLKRVLPSLIPEMSYDCMGVANGTDAGSAYEMLVKGKLAFKERQELRQNLLKYCEQDTLAMVKLLQRITQETI